MEDYTYSYENPIIQGQLFPDTPWAIEKKIRDLDYPPIATITFGDLKPDGTPIMVQWMNNALALGMFDEQATS